MRIGIDVRELSGEPTGVGRYLQHLLHEWSLLPQRHHWTLYTPDPRISAPPNLGAEIAVMPGGSGTMWEQTTLAGALRRDRPDVFFAPAYTAPLNHRVPFVVTMHDVSFAAHPEWFGWRERTRRRVLAGAAVRRARVVLTVSRFSRDEIIRVFRAPSERIQVIPNGVGLTGESDGAPGREPLVLYVGSVFNRRHLPELIEGFARLTGRRPDVRLEIVGSNRTHPPVDLAALASRLAPGRVDVHEYLDDGKLRSLYARASAFAFLSEYEGFAMTPLEALASGIPPVLLDTPVAREIFDSAALYVRSPTADLIADALNDALGPGVGRMQVLRSAPDVLARYDWRPIASATLSALEQAARA